MSCLCREVEAAGRPVGGIAYRTPQAPSAPTPRARASVARRVLARSTGPSR